MSRKAHVSQVEALERFRTRLVLFLERAHIVLDEVNEEVKRTRIWLQSEQGPALKRQMKRKNREMEMLQQELFTARLSPLKTTKTGQQMRINRKREEMRELEAALRAVTGWLRNYDSVVETEARKVEKLRQFFDHEMKNAVHNLSESYRLLREYQSDSPSG